MWRPRTRSSWGGGGRTGGLSGTPPPVCSGPLWSGGQPRGALTTGHTTTHRARGSVAEMQWKGGGVLLLQGAQLMPSHCPPDSKCKFQ